MDFTRRMVVAATVEPDFSGKELCDGCGVLDPLLVPGKLLLSGEYARLVKEITKLSGFAEQEDEVKTDGRGRLGHGDAGGILLLREPRLGPVPV